MKKNYKILDWDSTFFGYKIAEVTKTISKEGDIEIFSHLYREGVKLAIYRNEKPIPIQFIENNNFYEIKLIIKRIPIKKKIGAPTTIDKKITFYNADKPEPELIKLAQLAGKQGRFGNDANIPIDKRQELYKGWLINSVKKEMADEVLIYREEGKIVGFATLKISSHIAYAPLFAVQREFEGKGISFALMRAVETTAQRKGAKFIMSGTQEKNLKALKIFERFGMIKGKPEYVYHLWNKKQCRID